VVRDKSTLGNDPANVLACRGICDNADRAQRSTPTRGKGLGGTHSEFRHAT
jgi:hypothetical protein